MKWRLFGFLIMDLFVLLYNVLIILEKILALSAIKIDIEEFDHRGKTLLINTIIKNEDLKYINFQLIKI